MRAEEHIRARGATPNFLGYHASSDDRTSVNGEGCTASK
jgi:hypothetical protein